MYLAGAPSEKRGQPLVALGGILLCWIAARAAFFDLPPTMQARVVAVAGTLAQIDDSQPRDRKVVATSSATGPARESHGLPGFQTAWSEQANNIAVRPMPFIEPLPSRPVRPEEPRYAAAHNLLWIAAMGAIPLLPEVAANLRSEGSAHPNTPAQDATATSRRPRWSGDGWLMWRAGTSILVEQGPVTPVYGASQAGALLRYDLAPSSQHRPTAYFRAVRALEGSKEGDIATGISLRPVPSLPVTAHGEARLSRRGNAITLRPAAYVSGGFEDSTIDDGIVARGYAQAGYVGAPDATAFADGSVIAEKPLWRERSSLLTAGAGAWGGAQRGSARLDLGPSASLKFRLGEGTARVSADYRLRVAGNAEPASGAALTLSAGF